MYSYSKLIDRGAGLSVIDFAILLNITDKNHTANLESIGRDCNIREMEVLESLEKLEGRSLIRKVMGNSDFYCSNI